MRILGLPAHNDPLHGGYGGAQRGVRYEEAESTGDLDSRGKEQNMLKNKIVRRIKRDEVTKEQDILSDRSREGVERCQVHPNSLGEKKG